mmetsp:Transcript_27907/g.61232  ORF Transcript_27907/g.61232 Transcript_27907/m.61232 type:complete len:218 (-) Transcript_27907:78-731(-)
MVVLLARSDSAGVSALGDVGGSSSPPASACSPLGDGEPAVGAAGGGRSSASRARVLREGARAPATLVGVSRKGDCGCGDSSQAVGFGGLEGARSGDMVGADRTGSVAAEPPPPALAPKKESESSVSLDRLAPVCAAPGSSPESPSATLPTVTGSALMPWTRRWMRQAVSCSSRSASAWAACSAPFCSPGPPEPSAVAGGGGSSEDKCCRSTTSCAVS